MCATSATKAISVGIIDIGREIDVRHMVAAVDASNKYTASEASLPSVPFSSSQQCFRLDGAVFGSRVSTLFASPTSGRSTIITCNDGHSCVGARLKLGAAPAVDTIGSGNGVLVRFGGVSFGQFETDDGADRIQWYASFVAAARRVGRFVGKRLVEHLDKTIPTVFVIAWYTSHVVGKVLKT